MRRWVWMNAWDLDAQSPAQLIDQLREAGLNGCSLGLSYHGGRMLLARNAKHVVYEQRAGALYFAADRARFPAGLQPEIAEEASLVTEFLKECARQSFDAQAWTVLCHNDAIGIGSRELCVENAFGETYPYALCPAQERVQDYCVELCRQAAGVAGITGLDLEALGWLGYEHQGLHDKRGVPLSKEAAWWLSICCCEPCRAATGDLRGAIRERVRAWLKDPWSQQEAGFDEVAEWRAQVQRTVLERIRAAAPHTRLNLRLAQDRKFSGGKSTLNVQELGGLVNEVTVTYFGATESAMQKGLAALPPAPGVKRNAGFVFHSPDCGSREDVTRRVDLLRGVELGGWGFYGYGMAADAHWTWLREAIKGEQR
jgi:hypothetical protein